MRYAIYFTPAAEHPLTRAASAWLGRDAFGGEAAELRAPAMPPAQIAQLTAAPRRYGFHATIVAPFRLAPECSEAELLSAFEAFCADCRAFDIPRLQLARLDRFLALRPSRPLAELTELACEAVEHFRGLHAPLGEAELARRNPESLSMRQLGYLQRYGYPYVMEEFRFHMTLTGPLRREFEPVVMALLAGIFDPLLVKPVPVDGLALFVEPEPGAPFHVHSYRRFASRAARKSA